MRLEGVPKVSGRQWKVDLLAEERGGHPPSLEGQRGVEAAVLTALIDNHPRGLDYATLDRGLTSIESTPERSAAIRQAVGALIKVGLAARSADGRIRLTLPGVRAGQLGDFGMLSSGLNTERSDR